MKYNIWNKWDKLKVCMLGNNWGPEFFENIKDDSVRSPMQRIANKTLEELSYFEGVLKDFGCEVIRPKVDNKDRIENYLHPEGAGARGALPVPRSALQIRDDQLVSGNKLYTTNNDNPDIMDALLDYSDEYEEFDLQTSMQGLIWTKSTHHVPTSANSFLIGNDVYMSHAVELSMDRLSEIFPDTRINMLPHDHTHTDACFHPIKPGAILSLHNFQNYENTFPDWDVCYLEGESWAKIRPISESKKKGFGHWWVAGEEDNDRFSKFVNDYLDNWVGFCEESVFDVNVLVLDEHHVCVSNLHNETLNAFLKKHKMEPVHIPWTHRYFWDGGLHCITLDLVREGNKQDYFPDRKHAIIQKKKSFDVSHHKTFKKYNFDGA